MIENFENKYLQSFEYETTAISDGNIIGTCELGKATIQMINDSNEYSSLKGQWIKTIHGSFYIYDIDPVQEKVNIKLSCYDVKYKLDTDYDSSLYTWPMTLKEWRNAIFTNCGVSYDNTYFPNSDLVLEEEPYIGDNPSNRNVIILIAQAGCSWVDADSDDIFYFRWFEDAVYTVKDWLELATEKEYSNPINVMVLGRGDVEDNVYYPETLPNNPVEFRIDNNYILDPQDDEEDKRYSIIQPIYNRVNGFSYLKFNMRAQQIDNKLNIKLGQKVSYIDLWGNELTAYIMSKKLTWLGGEPTISDNYEITLSAEEIKETTIEYSYASSIENKLRKTQITVDKQNKKIEAIASDVNENTKKVASLEITTGNISTKVSSVENNLATTNSNLSNLSNTVDTLSEDIDGVSADFEDFKDNEYIQSIDNLQKQIDGAIQFWNGAEIPTINNYPANEWTAENDKINHQADIYTVVEDIDGEMKQGKSYRFDKIDGVWQWIELTDNELSAVQAIAQEALDKAKANATDIGTIKTNVSELQQTDEQLKASVESIDKQIIPTATATGSNIYVEDASDDPLIKLEIEGKSEQETRSGKNKFDVKKWVKSGNNSDYYSYSNGILSINSIDTRELKDFVDSEKIYLPNGDYIISNVNNAGIRVYDTSSTEPILSNQFSVTLGYIYLKLVSSTVITCQPQIEEGSQETSYEPYGVSPSPDYPSEIKNIGYENSFDVATWITKGNNSNYYSYSNGVLSVNALDDRNLSSFTENEKIYLPNGTYYISNVGNAGVRIYNDDTDYPITTSGKFEVTLGYVYLKFVSSSVITCQPMIVKGSRVHPYIPYGKYGFEVVNTRKNKFDEEQAKINSNYIANSSIGSSWKTITIDLLPNTQYTVTRFANNISVDTRFNLQFYLYEDTANPLFYVNNLNSEGTLNKKTLTFTTGESGKLYLAHLYGNDERLTTLFDNIDIQIEKGTGVTEFEQYFSNSSVFVLDEPPRSLPNGVKDIAYIKNNKLYVDRCIGSVVLNGSENWGEDNVSGRYITIVNGSRQEATRHEIISTHFKYISSGNEIGGGFNYNSRIFLYPDTSVITTLEEFKTWLSTHNVQVDYELATPYTEEIGEIEMPSTFKGVNHISTTDELEPTINIEYVRDTTLSNYVENQINKVMTIEERHYSELVLEDNNIKASVTETQSSLDGTISNMNKLESTMTSHSATLEIISKNIDKTTGEVREVTTTTGFTFNAQGSSIKDSDGYEILQTTKGAYYKDGDTITGQYTKDGSKQKDLELFGTYSYGKDGINDTPMFIAQLYTDENGEECFGHFYNGGDY